MCYLRSDAASVVCAYLKENEAYFKNSRGLYPPNYFTPEQQQLILEMESRRRSTGKGFRFYIISKEHKAIIGDIHFNEIVRGAFQSCFVGYKVAEEYSGKGIMSEALQLASHYVFDSLELHRLEANIMPSNKASIRVAEKVGFKREGLAERFLKINGQWEDHVRFALLNETI